MDTVLYSFFNLVLGIVDGVFDVLFFWLPDDPITSQLQNWDVISAANVQAVRWLNWFVDVQFYSEVFGLFVAVFLAFATWKVVKVVMSLVFKAVESVPVVE